MTRGYPSYEAIEGAWDDLGGATREIGRSCLGRPIRAHELGDPSGPVVLLTALVHGMEVVGSLALLELARALSDDALGLRLVFVPIANPDGAWASLHGPRVRRTNARGVDLNRNFESPATGESWHPMAGSRRRWSPYFGGERPFSEPETQALRALATELVPSAALGFHSIGGLIVYPWGHTRAAHPRVDEYRALASSFAGAQREPYRMMQARGWYPTTGDLDDWLDHRFGTLALTVEVGRVSWGHVRRMSDPFWWMNPAPAQLDETIAEAVRGARALLGALSQDRHRVVADALLTRA